MTTSLSKRRNALITVLPLLLGSGLSLAQSDLQLGGHTKGRVLAQAFPGNSAFRQLTDSPAVDFDGELRLNWDVRRRKWSVGAAYQLFAGYGNLVNAPGLLPGAPISGLPNDDRRLFKLTSSIDEHGSFVALHRLDRLWLGYTSEKGVIRFGRQALSWGNGLFFSPMDIVNPFDPAAIDTEYKAGDDMLYGQYLTASGNDVQAAYVARRNADSGDPASAASTAAVKFHGIAGDAEYDVLIARNYGDTTIAFGGNLSIGGAIWRGDIVMTDGDYGSKLQLVTNLGYSWTWRGRNVSGVIEYFFDDHGLGDDRYNAAALTANAALLERLVRGQSFTIGRHYLAAGLTIELNPLWNIAPNIFANLGDRSALLQILTRNNLGQNLAFTGAVNVPFGPDGSEYGGIALEVPGVYLSTDWSVFAQIAWYF